MRDHGSAHYLFIVECINLRHAQEIGLFGLYTTFVVNAESISNARKQVGLRLPERLRSCGFLFQDERVLGSRSRIAQERQLSLAESDIEGPVAGVSAYYMGIASRIGRNAAYFTAALFRPERVVKMMVGTPSD